ncbi:MAG: alpha/beta hydrolase [Ilumatobacteraceae bacterium]
MATTTTSDDVQIHYETVGAGPDVVLVHGLTDSSETWGVITPTLAERYRVTTLDLRGHGRSGDAKTYDSMAMTHDLEAVVTAAGIENPLLVGHSLGGIVVTAYGASAPTRGIVDVDQALQLSAFQAALLPAESMLRDPDAFPAVIAMVFDAMDGEGMTEAVKNHVLANRRPRQDVVLGVWDLVFKASVDELDRTIATIAGSVSAPFLALQYMEPPPGYATWLQELITQAVVEQAVAGSGHYEHLLDPTRFVNRVIDFDRS